MKFEKRTPSVSIELQPGGCDTERVCFRIGENEHIMTPCTTMGSQFGAFLSAIFHLYVEREDEHGRSLHHDFDVSGYTFERDGIEYDHTERTAYVHWDEEGFIHDITLRRVIENALPEPEPKPGHPEITVYDFSKYQRLGSEPMIDEPDPITMSIRSGNSTYEYTLEARDLCYAAAKACTEAIKAYGVWGYHHSSNSYRYLCADNFDLCELLFIKAYALNAMDVRKLTTVSEENRSVKTSCFEQELELLLFDM